MSPSLQPVSRCEDITDTGIQDLAVNPQLPTLVFGRIPQKIGGRKSAEKNPASQKSAE